MPFDAPALGPARVVRVHIPLVTPRGPRQVRGWRLFDERDDAVIGRDCHTVESARALARFFGYVIVRVIDELPPAAAPALTPAEAAAVQAVVGEAGAESAPEDAVADASTAGPEPDAAAA
jgi:hypothetical protein